MSTFPDPFIRHLGLQPYGEVWRDMKRFTDERNENTADEFWLVTHPPVFTLGQAGKEEHLVEPGNIPVIKSDRGGQVTYHGPGQPIIYLLLNLRRLKMGVRELVSAIEHSIIELLGSYQITATARKDAPGVYVAESKIASLGLRVRKSCSYHGLSFNLNMDLEPYSRINVCGYPGLRVTQLADLIELPPEEKLIFNQLINCLIHQLGYTARLNQSRVAFDGK